MLTCKQFLQDLNDYLDQCSDQRTRTEVEEHINNCPNCWVVYDTTKKTLQVYKGMEPQTIPETVHTRLMSALQRKIESKGE